MLHKLSKTVLSAAAAAYMVVSITPAGRAQTQNTIGASAPQLTEAQMAAVVQALALQTQNSGGKNLTPAEAQLLMQYLAKQNQAAAAALTQAQSQAALQALAGQSQARPPAASFQAAQTASMPGLFPAVAAQPAPGPKKPGIARIGVVQPRAQMGQGNSGANVAEPIRATIIQYLSGPAVEVVPLAAMIPSQVEGEARQKECDYVLYAGVSQKMNSGGMGFLKKAAPFASMVPMVGMLGAAGSVAGAMAGAAAGTAMSSAASVASTVKAKSEVVFDFKLAAPGSTAPALAATLKAKAKEDGEDVVTPLIEQADTAILTEIARRK